MIVVDASVVLSALVKPKAGDLDLSPRLLAAGELACPHLMDLEVAQTLRRFVRSEQMSAERAEEALVDFVALPLERYSHLPLLPRVWYLRDNFTAYDGSYVALAEFLDAPLWTLDERMARSAERLVEITDGPAGSF